MKETFRIIVVLALLTGLVLCVTSTCSEEQVQADDGSDGWGEKGWDWWPVALVLTVGLFLFCILKERGKGQ